MKWNIEFIYNRIDITSLELKKVCSKLYRFRFVQLKISTSLPRSIVFNRDFEASSFKIANAHQFDVPLNYFVELGKSRKRILSTEELGRERKSKNFPEISSLHLQEVRETVNFRVYFWRLKVYLRSVSILSNIILLIVSRF